MVAINSEMRSGKVQIPSGTWNWRLIPQFQGSMVTFQHRERQRDEMRTWVSDNEISPERAEELALEPVERLWVDADGLLWSISVRLPVNWASAPSSESLRLEFKCGSMVRSLNGPEGMKLGELSHFDLVRLFNTHN